MSTTALRTFTIRDDSGRALTSNKARTMDRYTYSRVISATRQRWQILALAAHAPRLTVCTITVQPLHRNGSARSDVCAESPTVKAAIDGLVDARVLPDDNPTHLLSVTFLPALVCGVDGLELTVSER